MKLRFPQGLPLKVLKSRLCDIERAALSGASTEELLGLIRPLANGYMSYTSLLDGPFYRGRPNLPDRRFWASSELWYPSANAILEGRVKQGRVNAAGQPIFYCSVNHQTVTRELNPDEGKSITVLVAKLKASNAKPNVFTIGAVKNIIRTGTTVSGKKVDPAFDFRRYPSSVRRFALMIDGFLSRVFTAEGKEYFNLTNAVSRFYLDSERIDGLVYPSVRAGGSWNLALKPSAADRLIIPESVFSSRLEKRLNSNQLYMRCDGTAKIEDDGTLVWTLEDVAA